MKGIILMAGALLPVSALALGYDFAGNFQKDNDIQQIIFSVNSSPKSVTLFSSSWDDGGFDPVLTLWKKVNNEFEYLAYQEDVRVAGTGSSNGIDYDYGIFDFYLNIELDPGTYIATISQYNNSANTSKLTDGFLWDNFPHFTRDQMQFGPEEYFNGIQSDTDARKSFWNFHVLIDSPEVPGVGMPETASSFVLLAIALSGLGMIGRRQK